MNFNETVLDSLIEKKHYTKEEIKSVNFSYFSISTIMLNKTYDKIQYLSLRGNYIKSLLFLKYFPSLFYFSNSYQCFLKLPNNLLQLEFLSQSLLLKDSKLNTGTKIISPSVFEFCSLGEVVLGITYRIPRNFNSFNKDQAEH